MRARGQNRSKRDTRERNLKESREGLDDGMEVPCYDYRVQSYQTADYYESHLPSKPNAYLSC